MSHRTRVKICGITRVEHGAAAADCGADAIGLVFWSGTPRCVDIAAARAIAAAVPPFVSVVGLFVDPDEGLVQRVLSDVSLAMLQFHGHEPPGFCRRFGRPYVKAIGVPAGATRADLLKSAMNYRDAAGWLFDAPPREGLPGGTGRRFDWTVLPQSPERPLVLSGGLDASNVADAIRTVRPWAVDVSSGVEVLDSEGKSQKGIKDPARIAAFIREVRNADG